MEGMARAAILKRCSAWSGIRADKIAPSNAFAKAPRQSGHLRIETLRSELTLCLTFVFVAAVKYEAGKRESAKRSLANAEKVYATVLPLVLHLEHSKYLTKNTREEFTVELQQLRAALNALKRGCSN
jgi:hypothetical protein